MGLIGFIIYRFDRGYKNGWEHSSMRLLKNIFNSLHVFVLQVIKEKSRILWDVKVRFRMRVCRTYI